MSSQQPTGQTGETITYYTPGELRASLPTPEQLAAMSDKDHRAVETGRAEFITESGEQLAGGFCHEVNGDEWLLRDTGHGVYILTGSEYEDNKGRRYSEGHLYDPIATPILMDAHEQAYLAKLNAHPDGGQQASAAAAENPMYRAMVRPAVRTQACRPWSHPARYHKLADMMIGDDEWAAVAEVIRRYQAKP